MLEVYVANEYHLRSKARLTVGLRQRLKSDGVIFRRVEVYRDLGFELASHGETGSEIR